MQAVVARSEVGSESRVMDVGTGTGILLRFLQGSGVRQVDLLGMKLQQPFVFSSFFFVSKGIHRGQGGDLWSSPIHFPRGEGGEGQD